MPFFPNGIVVFSTFQLSFNVNFSVFRHIFTSCNAKNLYLKISKFSELYDAEFTQFGLNLDTPDVRIFTI